MQRILVGVDGSNESKAAIRAAARLARATGSALTLAHVLPHLNEVSLDGNAPHEETQATSNGCLLLDDLKQEARDLRVDTSLLQGLPADRLAQEAGRADVWMVVVGHRGHGGLRRPLVGSVARRLTQISPRPVLVVR